MTTLTPGGGHSVFPRSRRRDGHRRDGEFADRARELTEHTADALGKSPVADDLGGPGALGPAEVAERLTARCVAFLRALDPADDERARLVCGLVLDLQQFALDVHQYEVEQRTRRLADCSAALSRLRALPGSADLLDRVCAELVQHCGFNRAVLSRVEDGFWKPWIGHFHDDGQFEMWFADWVDKAIPLNQPTPETKIVAERRAAVVSDTASAPVHKQIIVDSGRSDSYVVAPLLRGSEVIGFLHADYDLERRRTDAADRDVLAAFAEGFSFIYERSVLQERLRQQRDQVATTLTSALTSMDALCDHAIDLSRPDQPVARGAGLPIAAGPLAGLTKREEEVLRLMVAGVGNAAIAEKLVISPDTVKSHVKRILRKLGSRNRAEAIAMAFGTAGGDIGQSGS
ncbi:LuxR C-terminal-related transcriptional regulator [Amycolatopsis thermoflava]|uniref:LuxR C-terminal-related transcriptional regulator n=1 Tax=Amycolatopsis thermoflava TaxID=84480 RepID=UPI00382EDCB8